MFDTRAPQTQLGNPTMDNKTKLTKHWKKTPQFGRKTKSQICFPIIIHITHSEKERPNERSRDILESERVKKNSQIEKGDVDQRVTIGVNRTRQRECAHKVQEGEKPL